MYALSRKMLAALIVVLVCVSATIYAEDVELGAPSININTADAELLSELLVGVGPKTAEAIIEYRAINGDFITAEELSEVKGVGEVTLAKNRDRIVLE